MEPDPEDPRWKEIVGDNWPDNGPREWGALAAAARDAAATLDSTGFEQARRDFDEKVRASAGLQPAKDAMRAQAGRIRDLSGALDAAADAFGQIADLVHGTQHKIINIVHETKARLDEIPPAHSEDTSDDDNRQRDQQIGEILSEARAEVAGLVRQAADLVGPQTIPGFAVIAELLGHTGTADGGGPGHRAPGHPPTGQGDSRGSGAATAPTAPVGPGLGSGTPATPGPNDIGSPAPGITPTPGPESPGGPFGTVPDTRTPSIAPFGPDRFTGRSPSIYPNTVHGTGTGFAGDATDRFTDHSPDSTDHSPAVTASRGVAVSAHQSPNAPSTVAAQSNSPGYQRTDGAPDPVRPDPSHSESTATDDPATGSVSTPARESARTADSRTAASDQAPAGTAEPGAGPIGDVSAFMPAFSLLSQTALPQTTAAAAPTGAQAFVSQSNPAAQSSSSTDVRGPGTIPRVTASTAQTGPPGSAGGGIGSTLPAPHTEQRNQPRGTHTPAASPEETDDSAAESVRDAVGTAIAAAAGPRFVLGEPVDGDLVLARTLLRSILAAVELSPIAPAWAVSVMRQPAGVSVFLTSNEGRGWLPSGLFLPRELSTPWTWKISREAPWEGLSDPARILAEFGLAWGSASGTRLSAIASSSPIDPRLRADLREVSCEGQVGAAPELVLSAPGPGLVDRLETTASRRLLERVAGIGTAEIGDRCLDLAHDLQGRLASVTAATGDPMGASALRDRILTAIRSRRPVPEDLWTQLRDIDDLLAATVVAQRVDVARIPLGGLRNDRIDELTALRALSFQRLGNELVLLLARAPDRSCLRDAVYVHAHLADHPFFDRSGPTAGEDGPDRRRVTTAPPGT
ncbi:hypothetical protein [Nocardia sp. NPDC046763]|uniref:hypothetical protein n=1 Tax=Nocardia sp. NPDC046763 TaxID=3155256 RepID=UPI00340B7A49